MYQNNKQLIKERFQTENWNALKNIDDKTKLVEKLRELLDSIKN